MSSFKPFAALVCLLCLALHTIVAEKPNDARTSSTDGRGNDSSSDSRITEDVTKEIGGKTFEEWRKELTNLDPSVRSAALVAITQFKQAAKAVPDVIDRLKKDGDASPRVKAAIALRMITPLSSDRLRVIQALGHAISHDPQSIIRYEAVVTLKYRCPLQFKVKEERDVILDILASVGSASTFELRDACIEALIAAGVDPEKGPDPRVTRALIERASLRSEPTAQVRLKAIMALGVMGRPQNKQDWDLVRNVLSTGNFTGLHSKTIRMWSHVSLMALEEKVNEKDLKDIAGHLKDHEAALRVQAVTALGALEDKSSAYVGNLCDMVFDKRRPEKDTMVLIAIATALGHMKNNGERVQRALIGMTEYEVENRQSVVLAACNSMAQLRLNGPAAIEAMEKARDHVSLKDYQKELIGKYIKTAKSPAENEPVKIRAKTLDKTTAPGR